MRDETWFSIFLLCLVSLAIVGLGMAVGNPLCNCPQVGIRVTHDEQPIAHLYIQAHNDHVEQAFIVGSTDETGIFQFKSGWLWAPNTILYTFAWNGQSYAFQGPNDRIVDDPI